MGYFYFCMNLNIHTKHQALILIITAIITGIIIFNFGPSLVAQWQR